MVVEYEIYEESTESIELVLLGEGQSFSGDNLTSLLYQATSHLSQEHNLDERKIKLVRRQQ